MHSLISKVRVAVCVCVCVSSRTNECSEERSEVLSYDVEPSIAWETCIDDPLPERVDGGTCSQLGSISNMASGDLQAQENEQD